MLLLCPTDSSIAGRAATRVAAELAERLRIDLSSPDGDARDPDRSRRLLAAAHATGCDLLVVGYASRAAIETASTPGWQRRIVRNAPPPVMLVPTGAELPCRGGLMLGWGASALPRQVATTAARLARRLRTVLTLTDVLAGDWTSNPSRWSLGSAGVPATEAEYARSATMHEAALVVIAGRRGGRGLLPRRNVGHRPSDGVARLPVIVAAPRTRAA